MKHSWEFQKAVVGLLEAANITHKAANPQGGPPIDVATPIYDRVPKNTKRPFIKIGSQTSIDAGTQTFDGQEVTLTIHAWTDDAFVQGQMTAKSLLSQIHTALVNADIVIPNAKVIAPRDDFSQIIESEGGETHQGVFRLRCTIYDNG